MSNMGNNWERRWHPLLQEWVILAATTSGRPWSGDKVKDEQGDKPEHDPSCYLCPGVKRASGNVNPDYKKPFAFTNDFPSFSLDAPDAQRNDPFEITEPVHGTCRVVCFTPRHNLTMAELPYDEILDIIRLWKEEYQNLSSHQKISNVLIFENKGKAIGVSNPHPHGQIYATGFVPKIVEKQREAFAAYRKENKSGLLLDILAHEIKKGERIVEENDYFVAFVPFFARFVYETYIVPKRHVSNIGQFTEEETKAFAQIHRNIITRFDNLYQMSFPNITMLQNAPCDEHPDNEHFHFHVEFYPPLRSPDKLKYLAGFESGGGNIINPVKPAIAAEKLRNAGTVHYSNQ